MGVDILEAKSNSGDLGKATDAYPAGATSCSKINNFPITNIAMANQIVTFDVKGGGQEINLLDVELVEDGQAATKILRDGQVLIIRNGVVYNLQGAVVR